MLVLCPGSNNISTSGRSLETPLHIPARHRITDPADICRCPGILSISRSTGWRQRCAREQYCQLWQQYWPAQGVSLVLQPCMQQLSCPSSLRGSSRSFALFCVTCGHSVSTQSLHDCRWKQKPTPIPGRCQVSHPARARVFQYLERARQSRLPRR